MLAQGIPAFLVKPASIVAYWRGVDTANLADFIGRRDFSIQGSLAAAAHPPVRYYARPTRGAFHSVPQTNVSLGGVAGAGFATTMAKSATKTLTATSGSAALSTPTPLAFKSLAGITIAGQAGMITPSALIALLGLPGAAALGALVADTAQRINLAGQPAAGSVGALAAAVELLLASHGAAAMAGDTAEAIAAALIGLAVESGIGEPTVADNWRRLAPSPTSWSPALGEAADWTAVPGVAAEWGRA